MVEQVIDLVSTVEIPYANVGDRLVMPGNSRHVERIASG